jgi:hypothetical protein
VKPVELKPMYQKPEGVHSMGILFPLANPVFLFWITPEIQTGYFC